MFKLTADLLHNWLTPYGTRGFRVLSLTHLMRHLKWLSSLYQDAILGSNPCAHHDSRRGCQAKGTGTSNA